VDAGSFLGSGFYRSGRSQKDSFEGPEILSPQALPEDAYRSEVKCADALLNLERAIANGNAEIYSLPAAHLMIQSKRTTSQAFEHTNRGFFRRDE
jgi:hypothetical protein